MCILLVIGTFHDIYVLHWHHVELMYPWDSLLSRVAQPCFLHGQLGIKSHSFRRGERALVIQYISGPHLDSVSESPFAYDRSETAHSENLDWAWDFRFDHWSSVHDSCITYRFVYSYFMYRTIRLSRPFCYQDQLLSERGLIQLMLRILACFFTRL